MLDEAKKQKIIELVHSSTILTEQEKTDWLSLLELMNDKQIAELEGILKPKDIAKKVEEKMPSGITPTFTQQPPLSHISNLPSQITDQRIPIKPVIKPVVRPVPPPKPMAKPAMPVIRPVAPQPIVPPVKIPVKPAPAPIPTPVPVAKPQPIMGKTIRMNEPMVLNKLEDVAKISVGALHRDTRESFYKTIIGFAGEFGYFQTLEYFHESPLYKDYLRYGQVKLSDNPNQDLELTQEEFEFITDLLLALRINRV